MEAILSLGFLTILGEGGQDPVGGEPVGSLDVSSGGVVTAPLPVSGVCNESGSDRVQDDITSDLEEVRISIDDEGFVASLKEVANTLVDKIEPLRVVTVHVAHEIREVAVGRLDEEVVMVAHEAVGVEDDVVEGEAIGEVFEKSSAIAIVEEDLLTSIATSGNVIESSVELNAKRSCHRWVS